MSVRSDIVTRVTGFWNQISHFSSSSSSPFSYLYPITATMITDGKIKGLEAGLASFRVTDLLGLDRASRRNSI
jgi:hypothetical protein